MLDKNSQANISFSWCTEYFLTICDDNEMKVSRSLSLVNKVRRGEGHGNPVFNYTIEAADNMALTSDKEGVASQNNHSNGGETFVKDILNCRVMRAPVLG